MVSSLLAAGGVVCTALAAVVVFYLVYIPLRMVSFYRGQGIRGPPWRFLFGDSGMMRRLPRLYTEPFIEMWRAIEHDFGKVGGGWRRGGCVGIYVVIPRLSARSPGFLPFPWSVHSAPCTRRWPRTGVRLGAAIDLAVNLWPTIVSPLQLPPRKSSYRTRTPFQSLRCCEIPLGPSWASTRCSSLRATSTGTTGASSVRPSLSVRSSRSCL